MELRSGRRLRSSQQLGGGLDLISALHDDLILLVLARLRCAATAARTGILSRRWRGLWSRLRQIVFRGVAFPSLEAALRRISPAVSLLDVGVPMWRVPGEPCPDFASVDSLLREAARLAPEDFVFALPRGSIASSINVSLPCFHRATSMALDLNPLLSISVPAGLELPALQWLSLSGCIVNLDILLSRCPRLRELTLTVMTDIWHPDHDLTIHSAKLEELYVIDTVSAGKLHVDIVAPSLKQLLIGLIAREVNISVLAPMVENFLWHCCYTDSSTVFGLWQLKRLILQAKKRQGQLPSLHIHAHTRSSSFHGEAHKITQEIEKHMILAFSVFELHFRTNGHVAGALVFHLLEMDRIRRDTQKLKVVLQRSTVEDECPPDCPCEPTDWRSQTISLTALEEVEIIGFQGVDHEFDLLKLILRCSPMLKRITLKLSHEVSPRKDGCTIVHDIFNAYLSVKCDVYLSSGVEERNWLLELEAGVEDLAAVEHYRTCLTSFN